MTVNKKSFCFILNLFDSRHVYGLVRSTRLKSGVSGGTDTGGDERHSTVEFVEGLPGRILFVFGVESVCPDVLHAQGS